MQSTGRSAEVEVVVDCQLASVEVRPALIVVVASVALTTLARSRGPSPTFAARRLLLLLGLLLRLLLLPLGPVLVRFALALCLVRPL